MSELTVGTLSGLAANSYVIDVASGSQLTQPGMVLQVVSTTKTDTWSASIASAGSASITGLSASITPSSTSSKILISVSASLGHETTLVPAFAINRDGTQLAIGDADGTRTRASASGSNKVDNTASLTLSQNYLDSPSSTSSLTYSVDFVNMSTVTRTAYCNRPIDNSDSKSISRTASTITLMEIAG